MKRQGEGSIRFFSTGMPIDSLVQPTSRLDCLPTELLIEIFTRCLPDDKCRRETPLNCVPPWTITWVCRKWRNVCLSSPRLWSTILLGHYGSEPGDDLQIFDLWLSRSGILPLSISITHEAGDTLAPIAFNEGRKRAYYAGMQKLIAKLISVSHRWRALKIHVLETNVLDPILSALVIGAPQLETLVISTKFLGFFGDIRIVDLSLCPELHTVQLLCPKICPSPEQPATMMNMMHLNLRFCTSMASCLHWVDMCPLLETVVVRLFSARSGSNEARYSGTQSSPPPRRLRNLKYLELHCFSSDPNPAALLDSLELPNVEQLLVNMHDLVNIEHGWPHVFRLIERSNASLEILKLWGMSVTDMALQCLQLSPRLRVLTLGRCLSINSVLSELAVNPQVAASNDILCPHLEIIDLMDSAWSLDLLAGFIISRRIFAGRDQQPIVQPIRHLGVDPQTLPLLLSHAGARLCIESGLVVDRADADPVTNILKSRFDES